MASKFAFPFEQEAKRGEVPDSLSLLDAGACHRLRKIYHDYESAAPDKKKEARAKAAAAKEKLRQEWERESKLALHWGQLVNMTDYWRMLCRKDPSPENVTRLLDVLDGLLTEEG